MSSQLASLVVSIKGDTANLVASLDRAESKLGGFGKAASGVGKAIGSVAQIAGGFVVAEGLMKLPGVMLDLSQQSAQLELQTKKATIVFGEQIGVVREWASANAQSMGLTRNEATGLAAGLADLLIPMGMTREQAAQMATQTVGLAGALSEWTGGQKSATEVSQILSAAFMGERDALNSLGISITQAEVDARLLEKGQQDLTGAAKQQAEAIATQEMIFEKSADAQRAFAEGAGTTARRQAEATAQIKEAKEELAQGLAPAFAAATQAAAEALPHVIAFGRGVAQHVGEAVQFIRDNWPQVRAVISETLGPIATEVMETGEAIRGHLATMVGFFREHWDQIEPIVSPVLDFLKSTIENGLRFIEGVIKTVLNVIQGDWSGAWDGIKQAASAVWDQIRATVKLGVELLPAVIEAGMALARAVWDLAWDGITSGIGALWDGITAGVRTGIDEVVDLVRSLPAKARDSLGDLSRFLYDAGVQLIRGFISGIQSMAGNVASAAADVVRGAVDAARGALGIRSPSQVAHDQIGLPYSEGIARGIEAGLPAVEAAVSSVLSTMGQPPPGWVAPGTPQISAEDEARSLRYALLMSTMATGPDQAEFSLGGPNAGPRPSQNYNPAAFMKGGRPQDEVERDIRRAQMRQVLTNPTPAEGGFSGERTARDLEELIALLKRVLGRGFELTIDGQVAGRAMAPHIDRALGGGLTLNGVS